MIVVLAALCMKAVVPAGFMIGQDSRTFTVRICDETQLGHVAKQLVIPMKDGHHDPAGPEAKGTCAFATLGMASLGSVDPVLLALAIAFILALGFAAVPIPPRGRQSHLRPPLRGPPALI